MVTKSKQAISETADPSTLDPSCPLCWGQHSWVKVHEILAMTPREDPSMLITALSNLGVGWPAGFDQQDEEERSYGLLRMIDAASRGGLDCDPVGDRWIITRPKPFANLRIAA